jgi:hypothetical protein
MPDEHPLPLFGDATPQSFPYRGPPPPREGQLFVDVDGGFWKVSRLTFSAIPLGFYMVHLCYGRCLDEMVHSVNLGPRDFGLLAHEQFWR